MVCSNKRVEQDLAFQNGRIARLGNKKRTFFVMKMEGDNNFRALEFSMMFVKQSIR